MVDIKLLPRIKHSAVEVATLNTYCNELHKNGGGKPHDFIHLRMPCIKLNDMGEVSSLCGFDDKIRLLWTAVSARAIVYINNDFTYL